MRFLRPVGLHERLRVTHGQCHVAREEGIGLREGGDAVVLEAAVDFRLRERGVQQREVLVLADEVAQDLRRFLILAGLHERERVAVTLPERAFEVLRVLRVAARRSADPSAW